MGGDAVGLPCWPFRRPSAVGSQLTRRDASYASSEALWKRDIRELGIPYACRVSRATVDSRRCSLMPRLAVDFNEAAGGRVPLTGRGRSAADVARAGVELREGLRLVAFDLDINDAGEPDELEVEADAHLDSVSGYWYGHYDPRAFRYASGAPWRPAQ